MRCDNCNKVMSDQKITAGKLVHDSAGMHFEEDHFCSFECMGEYGRNRNRNYTRKEFLRTPEKKKLTPMGYVPY